MENSIKENNAMKGIYSIIPILTVFLFTMLGLVIPYMIISNNPITPFKVILFIGLLLISASSVSLVRQIKDTTVKSLMYIIAGFATFWIIGATYHGSYLHLMYAAQNNFIAPVYAELFYGDFIPVSLFAIANAIAVLVALIDGKKNGVIFGSMGIGVIIFSVAFEGLEFVNSRLDILLILIVLWPLIPSFWVRSLTSTIDNPSLSIEKRFFRVLKGALLTVPIYIAIGLLTYFALTGSNTTLETFSLKLFIDNNSDDLILFALSTGYYYILPNVILIVAVFNAYEFALHAFNLKKEIARDGTITYITTKKETIPEAKKEYDPFKDVIKDMKSFKKEFSKGKINRLVAAQKIGTYREQVDFLKSKYDIGSKEEATELLKLIERESEFAFK
ncbi:MAG: hypothetical protein K8R08_00535 [Methanosarcinales archaeon]|nr:hypothetical protein [Methanosarcinales archaeon]